MICLHLLARRIENSLLSRVTRVRLQFPIYCDLVLHAQQSFHRRLLPREDEPPSVVQVIRCGKTLRKLAVRLSTNVIALPTGSDAIDP